MATLLAGAIVLVTVTHGQVRPDDPEVRAGTLQPNAVLPETVAYSTWEGLVVIPAVLPDGMPHPAALATGLPVCLFAPSLATRIGQSAGAITEVTVWDRPAKVATLKPIQLRVGRVGLTGVRAAVLDVYQHLAGVPDARAPSAWLGGSFLGATTFTIDPAKAQVTFRNPNLPLPRATAVIPIEVTAGRIWVNAKVNGKAFRAVVDTTSLGTLLPAKTAREAGLTPATSVPVSLPSGKTGKAAVVDLKELDLGGATVPDVQALYIEDSGGDERLPEFGVIGTDVLLRYRTTISYRDRKMALEKVQRPSAPKPPAVKGAPPAKPRAALPVVFVPAA